MRYLTHYTESAQTKLFEEKGVFFAFSNKQLNEAKKDGVKYVSMGMGMICPWDNVESVITGLANIQEEGIKADIEENGASGIIEREWHNYESVYNDGDEAREALEQYNFDSQLISRIFSRLYATTEG